MPIKRLILVADHHDLEKLASVLVSAGVAASEIHISEDQGTAALMEMGVNIDVLPGRLPVIQDSTKDATWCGVP